MPDTIILFQSLFVLAVTMALPAALARWRAGSGWIQIGCALATWGLMLLSIFVAFSGLDSPKEAIEAVVIFAMFFGWMAVPMIALIYQVTNTPGWVITLWQQRARA